MTFINQFNNSLHSEIIKLCHSLKLKEHNFVMGCKLYNNYQRVAILILYTRSGKSLRIFCDEFAESKWKSWLQLKKLPSKSTIHSWLQFFSIDFIRNLIRFSIENPNPEIVAIDGSGVEAQYKSPYYKKRIGFNTQQPWHKLDIICDIEGSKQIIDFSFLLTNRHDAKVARQLFKRLKCNDIDIVADKGYYSFDLFDLAKSKRNKLIVPPKNFGGKTRHKNFKSREFHKTYYENEEKYALRNNVESVFSSLKRVQGSRIRNRLHFMKKREMAWNILWYNIRKKLSCIIFFFLKFFRFRQKSDLV